MHAGPELPERVGAKVLGEDCCSLVCSSGRPGPEGGGKLSRPICLQRGAETGVAGAAASRAGLKPAGAGAAESAAAG